MFTVLLAGHLNGPGAFTFCWVGNIAVVIRLQSELVVVEQNFLRFADVEDAKHGRHLELSRKA